MSGLNQKMLLAIMAVMILFVIGYGVYYFTRLVPAPQPPKENLKSTVARMEEERQRTEEILKIDPSDPVHISNLKYIQGALEQYYNDKLQYPKALSELVPSYVKVVPRYSSRQDYFYAHNPADKPQSYHLGSLLGGRNPDDPEAFKTDSDFNSDKAGWAGGFSGTDPVYDLTNIKR